MLRRISPDMIKRNDSYCLGSMMDDDAIDDDSMDGGGGGCDDGYVQE